MGRMDEEQAVFEQLASFKWFEEVELYSIKDLQYLYHNNNQQ